MVLTHEVDLPDFQSLTVQEVGLSSATLMTAAPHLGKACENVNNEFMLCRQEHNDPRACLALGKRVTACTLRFFQMVKRDCLHEFNQYANCIDKSSGAYEPWHCRKTQEVFDNCMSEKLCVHRPGFGYFTRGRVHSSPSKKPPGPECPCEPKVPDPTPGLPDCKPRPPARFTSRFYWMVE